MHVVTENAINRLAYRKDNYKGAPPYQWKMRDRSQAYSVMQYMNCKAGLEPSFLFTKEKITLCSYI